MTPPTEDAGHTGWQRVDQLCDAFEQATKAGEQPQIADYLARVSSREEQSLLLRELILLEVEFTAGHEPSGESPRELYLARFPDHADVVEEVFREFETVVVDEVSTSLSPTKNSTNRLKFVNGTRLGDYILEDELARGGMGVVYRATQVSLNRPVALKMILSSHLAGDDEVRRFQIEAQAAAKLDHPGIVPVYEVGEVDRQNFFSMGLIEGGSLSQVVKDGLLDGKQAADLLRTIALAVQYAHTRNIVHRDLKPANVLLDKKGQPKITDFGLAKNIEEDSGMTATGAIMGTPGYMAPEQAAGDVSEIGPLADVYALGGILYFLLTGHPPFQGKTAVDTIQQVLHSEPTSPRQRNADVDVDLATICLKCLEKSPGARYASAAEVAEELTLYLNNRPITARPVGRIERSWRWCKRNPFISALGTLVSFALLAAPFLAWQQSELRTRAERLVTEKDGLIHEKQGLIEELAEKNKSLDIALTNERGALERKEEALEETEAAIQKFVSTVKEAELLKEPRFKDLLKLLLEDALSYYERFIEEHEDEQDGDTRHRIAKAFFEIGLISFRQGVVSRAVDAHRNSISICESLVRTEKTITEYRETLAHNYMHLGWSLGRIDETIQEVTAFRKAVSNWEQLLAKHPMDAGYKERLATSYFYLGVVYGKLGKSAEQNAAYGKAVTTWEQIIQDNPNEVRYQNALASLYMNIGKPDEALLSYQHLVSTWAQLVEENPDVAKYQVQLADSHRRLGILYPGMGKASEAVNAYQRSISIWEQLVRNNPSVHKYQNDLADTHLKQAISHEDLGNTAAALAAYQRSLSTWKQLIRISPTTSEYQIRMADACSYLGRLYSSIGDTREAVAAHRQGVSLWGDLVRENTTVLDHKRGLLRAYLQLALALQHDGDSSEASKTIELANKIEAELARIESTAENTQADLNRVEFLTSPTGWAKQSYRGKHENLGISKQTTKSGAITAHLVANRQSPDDIRFQQDVPVTSDQWYHLSGWVRTDGITLAEDTYPTGANLSVLDDNGQPLTNGRGGLCHTRPMIGTNDWTYITLVFWSGKNSQITVAARLGFNGGTVSGTAWFDDLCLIPIAAPDNPGEDALNRPGFLTEERIAKNLLQNPSFEELPTVSEIEYSLYPTGWKFKSYKSKYGNLGVSKRIVRSSQISAHLRATKETPDDIRFTQSVRVSNNQWYYLSGWIRTENVRPHQAAHSGAILSVSDPNHYTRPQLGTNDWTYVAVVFNSRDWEVIEIAA